MLSMLILGGFTRYSDTPEGRGLALPTMVGHVGHVGQLILFILAPKCTRMLEIDYVHKMHPSCMSKTAVLVDRIDPSFSACVVGFCNPKMTTNKSRGYCIQWVSIFFASDDSNVVNFEAMLYDLSSHISKATKRTAMSIFARQLM